MARGHSGDRIIVCPRQFARPGSVFGGSAMPVCRGNDLTGGVALPMFPAARRRSDPPPERKKADKSSGYHESGSGGIARQGEDDQ